MKCQKIVVALVTVLSLLTAVTPAVWAGATDTGELASCEIASAKGIPILGAASVTIDPSGLLLNTASFQTLAVKPRPHVVVLRKMVGLDIGVSPMQIVCDILNGILNPEDPDEATLAEQILAAAGLKGRTIAITKKGIFGCDDTSSPSCNPGLHPDFVLVPGSAEAGQPTTTALGTVILYAVR